MLQNCLSEFSLIGLDPDLTQFQEVDLSEPMPCMPSDMLRLHYF